MKTEIMILLVLISCASAASLVVHVRDCFTFEPIEGANVTLDYTNYILTNSAGDAVFLGIAAEETDVYASYPGYEEHNNTYMVSGNDDYWIYLRRFDTSTIVRINFIDKTFQERDYLIYDTENNRLIKRTTFNETVLFLGYHDYRIVPVPNTIDSFGSVDAIIDNMDTYSYYIFSLGIGLFAVLVIPIMLIIILRKVLR